MTNLSVIILVGHEERHVRRCLERLAPLEPRQVIVVESQKGDRTHEIATETAKCLNWRVEECLNGGGVGERCRCTAVSRRAMAEKKVAEWLAGVDEATFEAALAKLVEEKTAAGEYRFKKPEERDLALAGARRFFREFSRKIIELSDGRCVYFAPDPRSRARHSDNAVSWAEYAFHAVSNGGQKVEGQNYNERWYNPHKISAFALMDAVLKQERCFIRLSSVDHRYDAIVFAGDETTSAKLQVVTRLDEVGNIDANLSEVTFTASSKEKKPPRLVPLTEAVRTVVHYQTTAGSYPPNENSIAFSQDENKGVWKDLGVDDRCRCTAVGECLNGGIKECLNEGGVGARCRCTADGFSSSNQTIQKSNNQTILTTVWHDWPGLHAKQFNWALDALGALNAPSANEKCEVKNEKCGAWILRLDADEYLYPDTIEEVKSLIGDGVTAGGLPADVTSLSLSLARVFCGGKIRFGGTAHIPMVRFFKHGIGRCEDRAMDEHIITDRGVDYRLKGEFADDNLNDMDWWREKHRGYAKREAADALAFARGEIRFKPDKEMYYHWPRYLRAFAYFCRRYFLQGGFLDGYAGWMWNFWQGLWYRWIVDREIGRMRKEK